MDFKITNYSVTSEQLCLEQTAELPIDTDFTVPDYSGEICKIIKCDVKSFASSKHLSGNTLSVEGDAVLTVIYADKDSNIFSAVQEIPFKKIFETGKNLDGGFCDVTFEGAIHSCRAVTERRISIKASVRVNAKVTVNEKTEIITDVDDSCFETFCGQADITTPLSTVQKLIIIDEELTLPQNSPAAARVIRTDSSATVTDCKIIVGKVIVKGNLKVDVLYCTGENTLQKECFNIPFNQILDMPEINENCECEAKVTVCGKSITPRTNNEGLCNTFMLIAKLELTANARCSSTVPVIYDLYSTKFKTDVTLNEVKFTKIVKQVNETFLCKKALTLPEMDSEVLDLWCNISSVMAKCESDKITLFGSLTACILYKNADNDTGVFEKVIDFEFPIELDSNLKMPVCKPEIKVIACSHTAAGGNTELMVELKICAAVYDTCSHSLITDILVDENESILAKSALVAYFADKGENVWEICKSFSAKKAELMEINHLTEDILQSPKMLIVPLM